MVLAQRQRRDQDDIQFKKYQEFLLATKTKWLTPVGLDMVISPCREDKLKANVQLGSPH